MNADDNVSDGHRKISKWTGLFALTFACGALGLLLALSLIPNLVTIQDENYRMFDAVCPLRQTQFTNNNLPVTTNVTLSLLETTLENMNIYPNLFCARSLDTVHLLYLLAVIFMALSVFEIGFVYFYNKKEHAIQNTGILHTPTTMMCIVLGCTLGSFFIWLNANTQIKFENTVTGELENQMDIQDGFLFRFYIAIWVLVPLGIVLWAHYAYVQGFANAFETSVAQTIERAKGRRGPSRTTH